MPHRRRVQKGSFASHFDELVKHFHEHRDAKTKTEAQAPENGHDAKLSVHERLFEKAWENSRSG